MSAWLVKTRRAPSRHSRGARVYGHTTTAMHKLSTPPPPPSSVLPTLVETPLCVFSYGYDRDRIRRRCRLHKLDDMVDVKSPRCEMMGCRKQPCCGFPGLKPRFCSEHKQDGMLNLKVRVVWRLILPRAARVDALVFYDFPHMLRARRLMRPHISIVLVLCSRLQGGYC